MDHVYSLKNKFKFKIYYVERNPLDVINSIYKKKWWSKNKEGNIILVKKNDKFYPDWLNKKDLNIWDKSNEFEKSALYIIYLQRSLKNKKEYQDS